MPQNLVILCDFDGTIIENDCTDTLLDEFGPLNWTETGEQYLAGTITHAQMNQKFAEFLHASKAEIDDLLLKKIKIRTGFERFYKSTQQLGIPFTVVSGGWDLYIKSVLKFIEFSFINDLDSFTASLSDLKKVPLISNKVTSKKQKNWDIELIWQKNSCQLSSPCKSVFVDHLKSDNYQTICIGNSETDICMAEKADYVFATGSLPKYLNNKGVLYQSFDTFDQLIPKLKLLLN